MFAAMETEVHKELEKRVSVDLLSIGKKNTHNFIILDFC